LKIAAKNLIISFFIDALASQNIASLIQVHHHHHLSSFVLRLTTAFVDPSGAREGVGHKCLISVNVVESSPTKLVQHN
jgi:hypothetical protein